MVLFKLQLCYKLLHEIILHVLEIIYNILTTSITYDALGRLAQVEGAGHELQVLEYDLFDRLLRVQSSSGVITELAYADFSHEKLIASKSIAPPNQTEKYVLGTQEFDGLGRRVSKTARDRTTTFSYSQSASKPSLITTAAGNSIKVRYDEHMEYSPTRVLSWVGPVTTDAEAESSFTFSYGRSVADGSCSSLVWAQDIDVAHSMSFASRGNLRHYSQSITNGKRVETTFNEMTLNGDLLEGTCRLSRDEKEQKVSMEANTTYQYDYNGNVVSIVREDVQVEVTYDAFGRKTEEILKDGSGSVKRRTQLTPGGFGEELSRMVEVYLNTRTTNYRYDYTYDDEMKILSRALVVDGVSKLTESYSYDDSQHMICYEIQDGYDNDYLPETGTNGAHMTKQEYEFDYCDNVTKVTTTIADGRTDVATWTTEAGTQRVQSISHTLTDVFPSTVVFSYDGDGNLTRIESSEEDIRLSYNVFGRMKKYEDLSRGVERNYTYDPMHRVLSDGTSWRFHERDTVSHEASMSADGEDTELIRFGNHVVAEKTGSTIVYVATDMARSAIISHDDETETFNKYGPYGTGSLVSTRTGYSGQVQELDAPMYILGPGYRLYLPKFQMFTTPDVFSPFNEGGNHPYLYCGGDPINFADPTGRGIFKNLFKAIVSVIVDAIIFVGAVVATVATVGAAAPALVGATLGLVSSGLGLAAASLEVYDHNHGTDHSKTIDALGWASFATGVASMLVDGTPSASSASKLGTRKMRKAVHKGKGKRAFKNEKRGIVKNQKMGESGNVNVKEMAKGMEKSKANHLKGNKHIKEMRKIDEDIRMDMRSKAQKSERMMDQRKAYEDNASAPVRAISRLGQSKRIGHIASYLGVSDTVGFINSVADVPPSIEKALATTLAQSWSPGS